MLMRPDPSFHAGRPAGAGWQAAKAAQARDVPRGTARPDAGRRLLPSLAVTAGVALAGIAFGEGVTEAVDPRAGIGVHALLLTGFMVQAARVADAAAFRLLVALCLAPLIRILSLSMPLAGVGFVYWYLIIATPLVMAGWVAAGTLSLSRADLGLRLSHLPLQAGVSLLGFGLGAVEYLILRPAPLVASPSFAAAVGPALVLMVGTGFVEEFIFRGVMQSATKEALGRWNLVYVSAIFAVLHLGYQSALDVAFVFAVGWLFALVVRRTGSLAGVTVAHGLTNITLFLIAPFVIGGS